ncbi:MAG: sulfatase activating formylglycine-generating enzyme [Myxococcota bacterium]|jgi:formylglycine-generating enzyme required for sulfatase activity
MNDSQSLSPTSRLEALLDAADRGDASVAPQLVALIDEADFTPQQRMALGEALGQLGDPRLCSPDDAAYWVTVDLGDDHQLQVSRNMVTTTEWLAFLDSEAYSSDANWTEEGLTWRDSARPTWTQLASAAESRSLVIPNQPVVGVSWYEAMAYASAHSARLIEFDERVRITRGAGKRPYPWGAPFGQANANTREEVLGKPVAVGVFPSDRTPEGVNDLAGNVGEWTVDVVGDRRVIHPGSWEQPSMAAWAKALHIVSPAARTADLGFRLVRDLE